MGTQSSTESIGEEDIDDDFGDMLKVNRLAYYKQSTFNILTTFSLHAVAGYPQRCR